MIKERNNGPYRDPSLIYLSEVRQGQDGDGITGHLTV